MSSSAALIAQYGFACVAVIIFAGELGLPVFVPGEVALLLAGSQLIHSVSALALACLAFGTVDLVATSTLHGMARSGGNRLLRYLLRRVVKNGKQPETILSGWRARLGGHDALVIFLLRFVPVLRMYASLISGLLQIRLRHFLMGVAPAAFLWASIPLVLGFVMRRNVGTIQSHYSVVLVGVFVAIALGLVVGMGFWWVSRNGGRMSHAKNDRTTA